MSASEVSVTTSQKHSLTASTQEQTGNFKGVMLCNRPFNTNLTSNVSNVAKVSRTQNKESKYFSTQEGFEPANPPFYCTPSKQEQLGLNPIKKLSAWIGSDRPHKRHRHRNRALWNHKKYLRNFQEQRKTDAENQERLAEDKIEIRQKFKDHQHVQREKIIQKRTEEENIQKNAFSEEPSEISNHNNMPLLGKENAISLLETKPADILKPRWAMTEGQAKEDEEQEIDNLLKFVSALDFEEYVSNVEVRTALESIKTFVANQKLCEAVIPSSEESTDNEQAMSMPSKVVKRIERETELSTGEHYEAQSVLSCVSKLAQDNNSSLRVVHSKKSMACIIGEVHNSVCSRDLEDVKVVTIHEDDRSRINKKLDVSNLPYIRRNPAI